MEGPYSFLVKWKVLLVLVFIQSIGQVTPATAWVSLTSNVTLNLNGTIPPGEVKFTCRAINVSSITWSFDDKLITIYNASSNSQNRSEKIESLYPHVSVAISSVKRSNLSKDSFDIVSNLTVSSTSLADVSSIECGSGGVRDRIFNVLSPNPTEVMLSEDSSINLTSNFSHLHGDICSEYIQFTCVTEYVSYLQWQLNGSQIARYDRSLIHSHPHHYPLKTYPGTPSSVEIYIENVKENDDKDNLTITSTLTVEATQLVAMASIGCGGDILQNLTLDLTVSCPIKPAAHATLRSNISLQGEICPTKKVQLTCDAENLDYLEWFFNDYSLIKYSYSKGDVFPLNLCNNSTDNDHLDSLCKNASFFINSVTESSGSDNHYNFLSTITFQEDYISSNSIRAVQCGSDEIKDRIFTNFTVFCNETKPSYRVETCDQTHLKYICEFCLGNASVPCDTLWKFRNKCFWMAPLLLALTIAVIAAVTFHVCCCCCHFNRCCPCYGQKWWIKDHDSGQYRRYRPSRRKRRNGYMELPPSLDISPPSPSSDPGANSVKMKEMKLARDKQRTQQEAEEGAVANGLFDNFFEESKKYKRLKEYKPLRALYAREQPAFDLGCRLQKYWCKGYKGSRDKHFCCWWHCWCCWFYERVMSVVLVTQAPLSKKCVIPLGESSTLRALNNMMKHIKEAEHPYIQPILEISFNGDHVFVVQPFRKKGSIRDELMGSNPNLDWAKKYEKCQGGKILKPSRIRSYGGQILQAIDYLYSLGLPCLGHVHIGNIFVKDKDCCLLGGYENTLLGYRTYLYRSIQEGGYKEAIDIIMFGHVIYEMACGHELSGIFPDDDNYAMIEDSETKEVIREIFRISKMKKKHLELMKEVQELDFFKNTSEYCVSPNNGQLSPDIRDLILAKIADSSASDATNLTLEVGQALPDIGYRKDRKWYQIANKGSSGSIQTRTEVPKMCPIFVSTQEKVIASLFNTLEPFKFLMPVTDFKYKKENGHHLVSMLQPYSERGSLRDIIHENNACDDWEVKAARINGRNLPTKQIANYGHQILKATQFLYDLGFPPLGHIQTGNIFVDGDTCRLGGYENTLLGYRTRHYDKYRDHLESIDVIMFGHVIFEMCTGREISTLTPLDRDYRDVSDRRVREVLKFIFAQEDEKFIHGIDEIANLRFFSDFSDEVDGIEESKPILSDDECVLLKKVRKGKARDQDNAVAKAKDGVKNKFRALPSMWYPAKKFTSGGRHSRRVPESEDRNVVLPSPVKDDNPIVVTIDTEVNS